MPNAWIIALKEWNTDKSVFCIPKRGTEQHQEVMKLAEKYLVNPPLDLVQKPKVKKTPKGR